MCIYRYTHLSLSLSLLIVVLVVPLIVIPLIGTSQPSTWDLVTCLTRRTSIAVGMLHAYHLGSYMNMHFDLFHGNDGVALLV